MKATLSLRRSVLILTACIGGFFISGTSLLNAAILVDTLGSSPVSELNVNTGAEAYFYGVLFDLEGADMTVESVSFSMQTNLASTSWLAGIFSSSLNSTSPTDFVDDLGNYTSTNTDSFIETTFTPGTSINLAADSRYWVVLGITSGQQGAYQTSTAPTDSASEPAITVFTGSSSGLIGRWRSPLQNTRDLTTLDGITLTGGSTTTGSAAIFKITGTTTPVPEPQALSLFVLAIFFVMGMRFRRNTRRTA